MRVLVQNTIIVNTRAPFDIHVTRLNISLKQRTSPGMWKSFNLSWWIDSTSKRGEYRRDRFHVKSLKQLPQSPPLRREKQREGDKGRELFLLNTSLTENFSRMQISRFRSIYRKKYPLFNGRGNSFPRGITLSYFLSASVREGCLECFSDIGNVRTALRRVGFRSQWSIIGGCYPHTFLFSFLFFFLFFFPFYRHASWTIR